MITSMENATTPQIENSEVPYTFVILGYQIKIVEIFVNFLIEPVRTKRWLSLKVTFLREMQEYRFSGTWDRLKVVVES